MILVRGPSLRSGRIFAVFSAFLATCSRKVLLPRIVATVTEISRDLTTVGSGSGRAERGRMTSGVRFVSAARAMLIALIVLGGVEVPQVALATNVFQQARSKEKYGAFVSGCPCGYDGSSKNANTCQDLCPRPIGIFSAGKTAIHSRFDLSLATRGALPGLRQVAAQWGASTYRHGGLMNGLEHIMYRHGPSSGFSNVSRFATGTRGKDVVGLVDDALRYGQVTSTGAGAYTIEYGVGRAIGTDVAGNAASSLRVFVRDGVIQTAFPF